MAEPDWNPDTGGRSLAEILREAGIESANRAARRRSWDDPEETGIRQRRAEAAAADGMAGRYGRRRSDQGGAHTGDQVLVERRQLPADRRAMAPERRAPMPERREGGERREVPDRRQPRRPAPDPSTAAIPGLRPDRKPGVPSPSTGAALSVPRQASGRTSSRPVESHPSTGPIPVVRPDQIEDLDDDLEATPRESALAWLRFAGELVIALAAGVGVYFAATVLWEIVPHVAVLLAPLAVTGLVTGVGVWRQRQGREPVGPRLLAILVFAGTLLTIAPAAGLLASS